MNTRILVVEDDAYIRLGLVEALEGKGYQVTMSRWQPGYYSSDNRSRIS